MEITASMARQITSMTNSTTTEIEKYILQCACCGGHSVTITKFNPLYESAVSNYEKLLDLGYGVDRYQYGNTKYSGIDSIFIYWGAIK